MANENRSPLGRRHLDIDMVVRWDTEEHFRIDMESGGRALVLPRGCDVHWIGGVRSKPHILDNKYPHVCFECKRELKWVELYTANCEDIRFNMYAYRKLKKLWKSQVVEFYCCNCFQHRPIGE